MRQSLKLVLAGTLGLSLLHTQAQAQSLDDSLATAYETSPVLAAERTRMRSQREGVVQARSGLLPSLSANATVTERESWGQVNPFQQNTGTGSYSVSAQQTLFSGGRVLAGITQAQAQFESRRMSLRATEQDVLLSAVSAHMNVIRDQQIIAIRSNNVEVLSQQLQAARDRFEVGEITRTDVAQAEARVSGARAQLSAAQAALAASRAFYERVVGSAPVELQAPDALPSLPEAYADVVETAVNYNPNLLGAQFNEAAAEQGIRIARGARLPEVSLSASASEQRQSDFSGPEVGSGTVRAQVSIPLFTGGLNNSRVRSALAQRDEQRLLSVSARRQVIEEATNAWNSYLAAQAVIESSREAVRANEIAFDGVEQEAFVGLRTTLDVLDAEQELLNSRLDLVRAERDLYVASYILLQSMGFLDAERLQLRVDLIDERQAAQSGRWSQIDLTPWN